MNKQGWNDFMKQVYYRSYEEVRRKGNTRVHPTCRPAQNWLACFIPFKTFKSWRRQSYVAPLQLTHTSKPTPYAQTRVRASKFTK